MKNRTRRKLAAITAGAVAVTALIGGTVAQYTDRDSLPEQALVAGTVDLEISDSTGHQAWRTDIKPMAAGDTFLRYLDLNNVGNLEVTDLTLAQENGGGLLVEGGHGVTVSVDGCDSPWTTGGACTGTEYPLALPFTPLANISGVVHLGLPNILPGETIHLKMSTHLPESAPNEYQDEASWVRYTFGVIQRNANAYESDGEVTPIQVAPLPLEEPELIASAQESDSVFLDWNNVQNATDYRVERSLDPSDDLSWTIVSAGTNTQLLDRSVQPGMQYYYRVKTFGKGGGEVYSNTATATTPMANIPPVVNEPSGQDTIGTESMTVSWSEVPGADEYMLEYSTDPFTTSTGGMAKMFFVSTGEVLTGYRGTRTRATLTNLLPATTYYFRVTAIGPGRTTVSLPESRTTKLGVPNLVPVTAADSATLIWDRPKGATSFELLRAATSDMKSATSVFSGNATSFTDTGLQDGRSYYFQVIARAGTITSKSTVKQVATSLVAPELSARNVTASSIDFSWPSVAGATAYRLERSVDGYFTPESSEVLYLGPATEFFLTGQEPATRYYYRISSIVSSSGFTASGRPVSVSTAYPPTNTESQTDGVAVTTTWDVSPGFTYSVLRNACGSTPYTTLATGLTVGTYTDSTPVAGQTYCYKVITTKVEDGNSPDPTPTDPEDPTPTEPEVDPITGEVLPEPEQPEEPQAPVEVIIAKPVVSVTGSTDDAISLSWNGVPHATSYKIERSLDGEDWTLLGSTGGTSYTAQSLSSSTEWYFRVTATDGNTSATSAVKTGLTKARVPSLAVSGAPDGSGTVTISSSAFEGLPIRVERSLSSDFTDPVSVYEGPGGTFADPAVFPGRRVYYRSVVTDTFGQSAERSASVLPAIGSASLLATPVSESLVTLSWTPVEGAVAYRVERSTSLSMANPVTVFDGSATSHSDSTVLANTRYYYRIVTVGRDVNATGQVSTLKTGVDASALSVGVVTRESIALSWTNSDEVAGYRLEVSSSSTFTSSTTLYEGTGTSFTHTGLPGSTTYYYRVRTTGTNGLFSLTPATPATTLISKVQALVGEVTDSTASLSWLPIDGATSYRVQGSSSPTFSPLLYNTSFTTLSAEVPQAANTLRYYRVLAYQGGSLVGEASDTVSATTKLGPAPAVTLAKPAAYSLSVSWPLTSGATSYRVERSTSGTAGPWTTVHTASSGVSSYTNSGLSGAAVYTYRVVAVGLVEEKESSNTVTGTPYLSAPLGFNPGTVSSSGVPLSWNPVTDADTYVLERSEGSTWSDTTGVQVYSGPNRTLTDSTVIPGVRYNYRVSALNSVTEAASPGYSTAVILVPMNGTSLSGTVVSKDTVTLNWTAQPGEVSYSVQRWTNAAPSPVTVFTSSNATSWTNTGLVPGTTYYYRLTALGRDTSVQSPNATFTTLFGAPVITLPPNQLGPNYTINWPTTGQVTGFLAQYSTDSDFSTPQTVATLSSNATSYTYTTLPASGTSYVRIVAYNATLNETSNVISIATPFPTKPNLTVQDPISTVEALADDAGREAKASSTVPLSWDEVVGADYYDIYTHTSSTGIFETTPVTRVPAGTLTAAIPAGSGTSLYYAVRAGGNNGSSSYSSAVAKATPPVAVPIISAASTGGNSVEIVVPKVEYSASYAINVYASETASPLATTVNLGRVNPNTSTSSSRMTITAGLPKQGTTYYFFTRATYGGYTVDGPNVVSATTAPPEPLVTVASNGTTSTDTVSWNSVANVAGYNLYSVAGPTETDLANRTLLYSGSNTSYTVPVGSVSNGYVVDALLQDGSKTHYGYGYLFQKSVPQFTFNHRDEVTWSTSCGSNYKACDFFDWPSQGNPSFYRFWTQATVTDKTSPVYGFPNGSPTFVRKDNYIRYEYRYYYAPGSPDAYYAVTAHNPFGAVLNATPWNRIRARSR